MEQKIKYLLKPDLDRLLALISNVRDRAIFTVAYCHGLRASEVGLLWMKDWNPSSRRLYIHRTKGSNSAEYKLLELAVRPLQAWLRDRGDWDGPIFISERQRAISRFRLHQLMRLYGQRAGLPIELRHFHTLRHSVAVHMTERGCSLQEVQDWLGHRSVLSTQKYAKLTSPARDRLSETLDRELADKPERHKVKWGRKR
jgi:site-specific recombinase XerD